MRYIKWLGILGLVGAGCASDADEATDSTAQEAQRKEVPIVVSAAVQHDVSGPLRDAPQFAAVTVSSRAGREVRPTGFTTPEGVDDPVVQRASATNAPTPNLPAVTTGLSVPGVGNGDFGFRPNAAPPDTNGVVGSKQYVQWVNESFAVFDKTTGAIAAGFPKQGNTIWAGFGGGCQNNNDGDPIVQYDKIANRWILTQFSVSTQPFLQCVAVSTTDDATGTYNRYAFQYANFPDYPKLSVWPDAYYITFNIFGNTFLGGLTCAYDRAAMLAGAAATQICFGPDPNFASPLPSDLDGSTLPPAGSPAFIVNLQTTTSLNLFKFHVDFATPANSTFTGPTSITVASFAVACSRGSCIPQPGTSQKLDGLSDRLMYRAAYRNFGDHETLLLNHSVAAKVTATASPTPAPGVSAPAGGGGGGAKAVTVAGIRWYELRSPGNGNFSVFQQATFTGAPVDADFRWMGSVAMDKVGNIAVGYDVSSTKTFPSLRFAVRAPTDAAGVLGNETTIKAGTGSQLTGLSRWGDYSALTVDPIDDCTMFYTNEYQKANGTFNWSTQIGSFKLAGCQ